MSLVPIVRGSAPRSSRYAVPSAWSPALGAATLRPRTRRGATPTASRGACPSEGRSLQGRGGEENLARDDLIQATGTVEKILGGGRYQIALESGQVVTAQLSGRMRRFRIRVIPGDRVQVGLSPYDPTHGFITFRLREGQNPPT